jgi:hypothetical protein
MRIKRTEISDLDVLMRVVEQKVLRLQVLSEWKMGVNYYYYYYKT